MDDQDLSTIEVNTFVDEQEWKLRDFVHYRKKLIKKEFREDTQAEYPVITMICEAQRRPGFFMWNIVLIMVNYTNRQ